ncbi:hypothetical protein A3Q56_05749, partial [Intoshia linei]
MENRSLKKVEYEDINEHGSSIAKKIKLKSEEEFEKNSNDSTSCKSSDAIFEKLEKMVMDGGEKEHVNTLPADWIKIIHNSGIPIYLNKPSNVITLSRPYYIGNALLRYHEIPIFSVPCLKYIKDTKLDEWKQISCPQNLPKNMTKDEIELLKTEKNETIKNSETIGVLQLRAYCEKLMKFKKIFINKKKNLKDDKNQTTKIPLLSENDKIIKVLNCKTDKICIINLSGRNDLTVLHAYTQISMNVNPTYDITNNVKENYLCKCYINDKLYGIGVGKRKKEAKIISESYGKSKSPGRPKKLTSRTESHIIREALVGQYTARDIMQNLELDVKLRTVQQ